MKEFDESKVKRDKEGRFAEKGAVLERKYGDVEKIQPKVKPQPKSKEEFFGVEYTGVKGRAAIDKILKEKQGHVKAAFHRKEIGDIDLAWGDENGGLMHVIKRRDEMLSSGKGTISGLEIVKKIPDIIENGKISSDTFGRISIIQGRYKVGINPTFDGEKINWIVTAMEIIKK